LLAGGIGDETIHAAPDMANMKSYRRHFTYPAPELFLCEALRPFPQIGERVLERVQHRRKYWMNVVKASG
jgi:hypothetical protein